MCAYIYTSCSCPSFTTARETIQSTPHQASMMSESFFPSDAAATTAAAADGSASLDAFDFLETEDSALDFAAVVAFRLGPISTAWFSRCPAGALSRTCSLIPGPKSLHFEHRDCMIFTGSGRGRLSRYVWRPRQLMTSC